MFTWYTAVVRHAYMVGSFLPWPLETTISPFSWEMALYTPRVSIGLASLEGVSPMSFWHQRSPVSAHYLFRFMTNTMNCVTLLMEHASLWWCRSHLRLTPVVELRLLKYSLFRSVWRVVLRYWTIRQKTLQHSYSKLSFNGIPVTRGGLFGKHQMVFVRRAVQRE